MNEVTTSASSQQTEANPVLMQDLQIVQTIKVMKGDEDVDDETNNSEEEEVIPKIASSNSKHISFPVDSILNAVIQDGDVVELLYILRYRSSEFDLNQRNHTGLTALHYAVLTNNLDSVKLLLNHGANVSSQDEYGFSPLHTAAALGFLQVTTLLIIYGADVFSLTNHSELPIDLAKDISVIKVLSNEMCLRLHNEQYIKSLILLSTRKVCTMICDLVLYIIRGIIFIVTFVFQKGCDVKTLYHRGKSTKGTITEYAKNTGGNSKQQTVSDSSEKKTN